MTPYLRETGAGVEVLVHVQPRASRTTIVGEHGGRLKIALAAPPVDGAANDELVRFLAETLGISRRAVELSQGASGRRKTLLVAGLSLADVAGQLG